LAGLTSTKGQTLEARVFSGIFPVSCVEVREVLGENQEDAVEDIEEEEESAEEDGHKVNGHTDTDGDTNDAASILKGSRRSTDDVSTSANGSVSLSPKKIKSSPTKSLNGKIPKSPKSKARPLTNGTRGTPTPPNRLRRCPC
jgi:dedicator of cytokinesis protein 3